MSANITMSWANLSSRLSQLFCGLGGHELLLRAEPGRLSLKCMNCMYETPGWTIKEAQARPRSQGRVVLVQQIQG
jgi:hypothetical protein